MNRRTIGIVGVALVIGISGALLAVDTQGWRSAASEEALAAAPMSLTSEPQVLRHDTQQIVVDGRVVPVVRTELFFESRDIAVAEILVNEGDTVDQNTPLARLDMRELQLDIEDAQASLAEAQALREELLAGATPEEIAEAQARIAGAQAEQQQVAGEITPQDIAAAQAELAEARAQLAEVEAGPRTAEVAAAQAALDKARTVLAQLESGPKTTEVQVAQAAVAEAQANLQRTRSSLSAAKTNAQLQMEQMANELRDRQDAYSVIYWENLALDEVTLEDRTREDEALRAVESAEQALEQARVDYEEAQQAEREGIAAAQADVQRAQAQLDQVLGGAESDELAAARAEVAQAEAELDALLASADADELAAARARVAQAEANLARAQGSQREGSIGVTAAKIAEEQAKLAQLTAEPRSADLAGIDAHIQRAEVILKQAELAFEKATLSAPIAGTVAAINIAVGEVPNRDEASIVVADTSGWQVETADLTELSVVHIYDNASATITFYALPDLELSGTVSRIKPLGANEAGETTYTVIITPDQWDERLKWNMTAQVAITLDE